MTPYSNKLIKWIDSKTFGINSKLELLKITQNAPLGATHVNKKGLYARPHLNGNKRGFVYINKKWILVLLDSTILEGRKWLSLHEIRNYLVQHSN